MWKFALLALALSLGACDDGCGNTLVSRLSAPDGRHSAVLFQRDCGATTGFSTQISILGPGEKPDGSGNAFVADGARASSWGGPWAEMKWLAPDHLLIRYDAKSRIFEQGDAVSGVRITYEAVNR